MAPCPLDTGVLSRFTGTAEAKASRAKLPLKRVGHADEIASLVVFLGTDEASRITGASIAVDGG